MGHGWDGVTEKRCRGCEKRRRRTHRRVALEPWNGGGVEEGEGRDCEDGGLAVVSLEGEWVSAEGEGLEAGQVAAEDPERRLEVLQLVALQVQRLQVAQLGDRARGVAEGGDGILLQEEVLEAEAQVEPLHLGQPVPVEPQRLDVGVAPHRLAIDALDARIACVQLGQLLALALVRAWHEEPGVEHQDRALWHGRGCRCCAVGAAARHERGVGRDGRRSGGGVALLAASRGSETDTQLEGWDCKT
jgi:hypothetical protein